MAFIYYHVIQDGDIAAFTLYRRHYSCRNKNPKSTNFVGVGQKLVLLTADHKSAFAWLYNTVKRWDNQEGVQCSFFRNESDVISSELIKEACLWAELKWPKTRFWTYVNPQKVSSSNPGYCYLKAGWKKCGYSKQGLLILEKLPE